MRPFSSKKTHNNLSNKPTSLIQLGTCRARPYPLVERTMGKPGKVFKVPVVSQLVAVFGVVIPQAIAHEDQSSDLEGNMAIEIRT